MKGKIIIGIIIVYIVIIGALLIFRELNRTKLVLYPNTVLEYDGRKWKSVEFKDGKEYNIYIDNKFASKGHIYSNDGEINIDGEVVYNYIASNKELTLVDFNKTEMTKDEVNEILDLAKLKSNFTTVATRVELDYDQDGEMETLYFLANGYNSGEKDTMFSIIYVKDKEDTFVLKETYYSEKSVHACDLDSVINMSGKYRLIVRCPGFSDSGVKVQIYETKNNKLVKVAEV